MAKNSTEAYREQLERSSETGTTSEGFFEGWFDDDDARDARRRGAEDGLKIYHQNK